MPHRVCPVSFADCESADTSAVCLIPLLYDAAALALDEFRRCGFAAVIPGPAARLEIAIKEPATTHEVPLRKLRDWVRAARSPRERVLKDRLKTLLNE